MEVRKQDILCALERVGVKKGDTIFVHSSLKSFGYVDGGAETVIVSLKEAIGEEGTLVMPTLSQKNWATVYQDWTIDRPSDVGLITETFRKQPNTLRSNQETHSVAASGRLAKEITDGHTAFGPRYGAYGDYAFSHSSPYQKMYDMGAKVLFLGADPFATNTFKHFCEYRFVEELLRKLENKPFFEEQKRKLRHFEDGVQKGTEWPYSAKSNEILEEEGIYTYTTCGTATLAFGSIRKMVDAIERKMRLDPARYLYPIGWLIETEKVCGVKIFS